MKKNLRKRTKKKVKKKLFKNQIKKMLKSQKRKLLIKVKRRCHLNLIKKEKAIKKNQNLKNNNNNNKSKKKLMKLNYPEELKVKLQQVLLMLFSVLTQHHQCNHI